MSRPNYIIISAGQSNGGAAADMDNATSPTYDSYIAGGAGEHTQVRLFRHWEATESAVPRRLECQSPVANKRFGPEISTGRDIHTQIGSTANIWIIQYIISGSNLHTDWDPDAVSGNQYYAALKTYYDTCKALIAARMSGTVSYLGFCWTQGEADGMAEANADAYDDNLTNLIDNVVADYGAGPFVFSRLGTNQTDITYLANMKTSQDNVDALGRSYVYMRNTDALTTVAADNTHWDADSEIVLGQGYALDIIAHHGLSAFTNLTPARVAQITGLAEPTFMWTGRDASGATELVAGTDNLTDVLTPTHNVNSDTLFGDTVTIDHNSDDALVGADVTVADQTTNSFAFMYIGVISGNSGVFNVVGKRDAAGGNKGWEVLRNGTTDCRLVVTSTTTTRTQTVAADFGTTNPQVMVGARRVTADETAFFTREGSSTGTNAAGSVASATSKIAVGAGREGALNGMGQDFGMLMIWEDSASAEAINDTHRVLMAEALGYE